MVFAFRFSLKKIKVLALIGESGTGKSFRAKFIAQKFGIEYIIDDGLLIKDNRIIAGHSAKKEKTFLAAVKVSLFDEKAHRETEILGGKKNLVPVPVCLPQILREVGATLTALFVGS